MARVIVVDDDNAQRRMMASILAEEGHEVRDAPGVDTALEMHDHTAAEVIVTDMKMPHKSGLDLVEAVAGKELSPEVVVITAFGTIETAVKAMRLGAYDYLTKPIEHDELIIVVQRAAEKYALRMKTKLLGDELVRQARQGIIAESAAMKEVLATAGKVAQSDATVLIRGESGTGKERIARYIHYASPRKDKPIQCINCAAFPETLLESELFGYERGAFTGATARKIGVLEAANGSTVFLDEVADMSLPLQAKVLRVLQDREIRRLGAASTETIDVRFIAATNKNLEECVKDGSFREDLFYRLNIIPLVIAPLRERPEDIPALARMFLSRRGKKTLSDDAIAVLCGYPWPGNVRELEAIIERIAILSPSDTVTAMDIPSELRSRSSAGGSVLPSFPPGGIVFDEWERSLLEQALNRSGGVMTEAAKLLGMTYRTFQYRAEKFGLTKPS